MNVVAQIRVTWLTCCQTSCLLCHLAVNCSLIVHQGSLSSFTCTGVTWAKGVFSFTPLNIWNATQYQDNGHYPVACGDPSGEAELYSHCNPLWLLYCPSGWAFVFERRGPSTISTILNLINHLILWIVSTELYNKRNKKK